MLRSCHFALVPFLFLSLIPSQGNAAVAGDSFSIPELAALVVMEGKDLKVQFIPPAGNRPEKYKGVDLRVDDIILLANGKRVKTVAELEKAHAATEIGENFKLGIQRGQEMMIVAFTRADPKDLPKMNMRIVTHDGGDGTEALPAVGVMLAEKGKNVVIQEILPMEKTAIRGLDVKAGDIITSMNGTPVSSLKDFISAYDRLEVGAKVEWKTERKGKHIEISFVKPKPMGRVILRKETK